MFFLRHALLLALLLSAVFLVHAYLSLPTDNNGRRNALSLILTPDQQAQQMMKKKEFEAAARLYTTPSLQGTALFRAGNFKEAAWLFSARTDPKSLYNRGTALIMAGLYSGAIEVLTKATDAAPNFNAARINLEIARIRKEKNLPPEDDHGGTGGMLEADEFVFSDRKSSASAKEETEEVIGQGNMDDSRLREMWLRRLESRPKDFLRVKFAYQKAASTIEENKKP